MKKFIDRNSNLFLAFLLLAGAVSCEKPDDANADQPDIRQKLDQYVRVRLTTDLSALRENQRQMIPLLIDADRSMGSLFWYEAYGRRDSLVDAIEEERCGDAEAIKEYFGLK